MDSPPPPPPETSIRLDLSRWRWWYLVVALLPSIVFQTLYPWLVRQGMDLATAGLSSTLEIQEALRQSYGGVILAAIFKSSLAAGAAWFGSAWFLSRRLIPRFQTGKTDKYFWPMALLSANIGISIIFHGCILQ
jgi:hypothetical protein